MTDDPLDECSCGIRVCDVCRDVLRGQQRERRRHERRVQRVQVADAKIGPTADTAAYSKPKQSADSAMYAKLTKSARQFCRQVRIAAGPLRSVK